MFEEFIGWIKDPVVIQVFVIVFATVVVNYVLRKLFDRLEIKVGETTSVWDDALLMSIRRPVNLMVWVLGVGFAAEIISSETDTGIAELIVPVRYVLIVVISAFFLLGFIREVEKGFIHDGADVTTANAVAKLLRVSVIITAVLTVLQTLGVSISGILAFGGIGGLAVGFAAKDILANFFGGLMIYLDQPFKVGDWVRSPDREVEGTVESIGWRLTVIRTFDRRPLYIPNSIFAEVSVENPSRMENRRIYETIGIRYDDADKMADIVSAVRTYLENNDKIDTSRTLIVNFNAFAASSLDFFIYTFTKTTNWVEFHGIKQDVLLDIYNIIVSHGAEVAFPTSTLHVASLPQPEPEPEG